MAAAAAPSGMHIKERPTENSICVPATTRNRVISSTIKPPCVNTCATMLFVAKPNSGKSVACQSFLKRKTQYRKAFHHVYLVAPAGARSAFKSCVFKDHPEEKVFDTLGEDTLDSLEEHLDQVGEENDEGQDDPEYETQYTLWCLDDVQAELKVPAIEKRLKNIFCSYRHRCLSVWCLVQSYMAVPKQIRDCTRCVLQWKPSSLREIETFREEVLGMLTMDQMKTLIKVVYKEKHDFMWVDRERRTITRNLAKLQITMDDDELLI